MVHYSIEEDTIFSNFLLLFLHVFKGLEYLHDEGIVHGDVKGMYMYAQLLYLCLCVVTLISKTILISLLEVFQ